MALPEHLPHRLPAGLCVFGFACAAGLAGAGTPRAHPQPLSGLDLLRLAAESGLSWVELPLSMLGDLSPEGLHAWRARGEALGLRFVVAGGRVSAESLGRELQVAAVLGAPAARCTLSGVLCGDRRGFPGGWKEHLRHCERELEAALPEAERLGIAIAIENHQDVDSHDLFQLCRRFESRYLGVTLDCGNPLAVMEQPVEFAERLAPYLRHAHLKDYTLHHAPNGFRLVRCALGQGVVDFPALLHLFDAQEWPITRNIELGALLARQIPILERSWWDELAPRDAREILPALGLVWEQMEPVGGEWRTPWERELPAEEVAAWEHEEYAASVAYLRTLLAPTAV